MYLKSEAYKGANTFSPHCMSLEVVYCQLDMCLCGFRKIPAVVALVAVTAGKACSPLAFRRKGGAEIS